MVCFEGKIWRFLSLSVYLITCNSKYFDNIYWTENWNIGYKTKIIATTNCLAKLYILIKIRGYSGWINWRGESEKIIYFLLMAKETSILRVLHRQHTCLIQEPLIYLRNIGLCAKKIS